MNLLYHSATNNMPPQHRPRPGSHRSPQPSATLCRLHSNTPSTPTSPTRQAGSFCPPAGQCPCGDASTSVPDPRRTRHQPIAPTFGHPPTTMCSDKKYRFRLTAPEGVCTFVGSLLCDQRRLANQHFERTEVTVAYGSADC